MFRKDVLRWTLVGLVLLGASHPAGAESLILEEITVRGRQQHANEETLTIREVRECPARDIGEALKELQTPDWAVTAFKAGLNWEQWSLQGGVNNLFDRYCLSHLSYQRAPFASGVKVPEFRRFAYVNLGYHYLADRSNRRRQNGQGGATSRLGRFVIPIWFPVYQGTPAKSSFSRHDF